MKTIEEYALALVADGAEQLIEDDVNEDGEIDPAEHGDACELAMAIVRAIRANPDAVLDLARLHAEAAG